MAKARLFRATLKGVRGSRVRRKVWRELMVPDRADLYRLGQRIVEAFGLFPDHAFGFYDNLEDPYRSRQQYELFVDLEKEEIEPEALAAEEALDRAVFMALARLDLGDKLAWVDALARVTAEFAASQLSDLEGDPEKRVVPYLAARFREAFLNLFGPIGPAELWALAKEAKQGVRGVPVARVFREPGDRMAMIFDYGDEWIFEVEYLGPVERKKGDPWVLRAHGTPPEQYPEEEEDF